MNDKVIVCGAGGYVGSRLVKYLSERCDNVVAVSSRPVKDLPPGVEARCGLDLRQRESCALAVKGARWVFNLAARVGGIEFVQSNTAEALTNVLINTHLVEEAYRAGANQYFFASSSCVYPPGLNRPLQESDCLPANPMGGYGWEKLYSEMVTNYFGVERNFPTCIARYHGIYGPGDSRPKGRDHVATALTKKVIHAKLSGTREISIWGDGEQTRSFLFINDCIEGTYRLMRRGVQGPVNLANPRAHSVNQLVDVLEEISGVKLTRFYQPNAPVGRQIKVSDNTFLRKSLNWEPETSLLDGMRALYNQEWDRAVRFGE